MAALQTEEWKRFRENTYTSFEQPVRDRVNNLASIMTSTDHTKAVQSYLDTLLSTGDYTKAESAALTHQTNSSNKLAIEQTLQDISKIIKGYEEPKLEGFSNAKFKGMFADDPSAGQLKFAQLAYRNQAAETFRQRVGRDPTQGELAAVFNGSNFAEIQGVQFGTSFLDNPEQFFNLVKSTSANPLARVDYLAPKFDIITRAQSNLQRYGGSLTNEQIRQITSGDQPVESAETLAGQFISTQANLEVSKQIPGLAEEQQKSITDLEARLGAVSRKSFEEQRPSIERNLAARRLLRGGSLQEAFGRQLGQLETAREGVIAPLRFETAQQSFQNQLQNTLRGALESGQNLAQALNFARSQLSAGRERQFTSGQQLLQNQFQQGLFNQQQALKLALANRGTDEGGALEDFYKYGLPVLGQLGGGFLSGMNFGGGGGGGASAAKGGGGTV